MSAYPQLVVDETLFLHAIRVLAEAEARGERFELLNVVRDYSQSSLVKDRFAIGVGREMVYEEVREIDGYVAAVHLVHHHNANLDQMEESLRELDAPVAAFVRTAAWAFLNAWSMRYGGFFSDLAVKGSLVDPSVHDVP